MSPPRPAAGRAAPGGAPRRRLAGVAALLGALCAALAVVALWAENRALDTGGFTGTAGELADDPTVREAVAAFLADELLRGVSTGALPDALRPSGDGAAAAGTRAAVSSALASGPVRAALVASVSRAHAAAVAVLRQDPGLVAGGAPDAVVLDLRPALEGVLSDLGATGLADALPAGAGRAEIVRSGRLADPRRAVGVLDVLAWVLPLAAAALIGLALAAGAGRRAALARLAGGGLLAAALALWAGRWLAGRAIVDAVDPPAARRPAAERAWEIVSGGLVDGAIVLALAGAALLAVGVAAAAARRGGARR